MAALAPVAHTWRATAEIHADHQQSQEDLPIFAEQACEELQLDPKLRISYDPAANSIYVTVADGPDAGFGETVVSEDGTIIDTDVHGKPRGYEFLMVREKPLPLTNLPAQVAYALSDFVSSGAIGAEDSVERQY